MWIEKEITEREYRETIERWLDAISELSYQLKLADLEAKKQTSRLKE